MFNIELNNIKINGKDKLTLKDKQSIIYNILNMYSDYGNLLHESSNNIKTGFSYYITKNKDKIFINISADRFNGLNLKTFLNKNKGKKIKVKENLTVFYNNIKIKRIGRYKYQYYDLLETLSPIYINTYDKEGNTKNLNLELNEQNINIISEKILENINNYTGFNLTFDDITIIPTYQTRLLTGFSEKHAWSAYYVKLFFKVNNENFDTLNKVKEILLTNFYKSGYTGYFILK